MMKRFRYMLANLISGGELTARGHDLRTYMDAANEYARDVDRLEAANARALELIERMEGVIADKDRTIAALRKCYGGDEVKISLIGGEAWFVSKRKAALRQIIACDTPGGNGTVKRMVRIAREGLE